MPDRFHTTSVRSLSSGVTGRCITSVRSNHFLIDDPDYVGGPSEAVTAAEVFFSGLTSCASLMLERISREQGISLTRVEVSLDGTRNLESTAEIYTVFDRIRMYFDLTGVNHSEADRLVGIYKRR
ncbi:hypothetical protein FIM12_02355 [SAR202 cluster bacterium AD-804-J14_MRT_500m]|nr:hypothetical protein [SAR202 cluster bacterium AD-804-J14_MRT_500m]